MFILLKLDWFYSPGVELIFDKWNKNWLLFIANTVWRWMHSAFHERPPPAGSDNKIYNASVTNCKESLSSIKCSAVIIWFTLGMQQYKSRVIVKCLHWVWAPAFLLQPLRGTLLCNCDRFNAVAKASWAYRFIKVYESLCSQLELLV